MSLLYFALGAYFVWLLAKNLRTHSEAPGTNNESAKVHNYTEEGVFKRQTKFEKSLENTFLPDALSGREIYTYFHLMRKWYDKLSSENRYDDKMIQRLREDWLDYMSSLEDRSTYNFLSLETKDEEEEKEHREKQIVASRKVFAIEDAFAAAVGGDAPLELAKIREMGLFRFSNDGKLAPEGSEYGLDGKLHKKNP